MNYRLSSSAYTGRAPRSMSAAFGCSSRDPLHAMPDGSTSLVDSLSGAARFVKRVFARLFGR